MSGRLYICVRRVGTLSVAALMLGCNDRVPTVEQARQLERAGDIESAIIETMHTISREPNDAELHVYLATLSMKAGDAYAAEASLENAVQLGIPRKSLLPEFAQALLMQKRHKEILASYSVPENYPPDRAMLLLSVQARAQLALPDYAPDRLFETLFVLFRGTEQQKHEGKAPIDLLEATEAIASLRSKDQIVARAYEHAMCLRKRQVLNEKRLDDVRGEFLERSNLRVGPDRKFTSITDVARKAGDGWLVEIDAGNYIGEPITWPQNDLTIRGVGGRPHVSIDVPESGGRDVWLFTGDGIVVENIELSGARKTDSRNGAAIRHTGSGLAIRNVYLHDNDNGILTANNEVSDIVIEYSEFSNNGYGDGYSHNIYVGRVNSLRFHYNYSHNAYVGHLLKSRAKVNLIAYNRLTDNGEGRSSYAIDLPNGSDAIVIGNSIGKGSMTENATVISYGAEGEIHENSRLLLVHNTFHSDAAQSIAVHNYAQVEAQIVNNIFSGTYLAIAEGLGKLLSNYVGADPGLADPENHDFRLTASSAAIDSGTDIQDWIDSSVRPIQEYEHPTNARPRITVWKSDIGAYEYCRP
jgi:hypothetical protein